jgi:hypothetical protein
MPDVIAAYRLQLGPSLPPVRRRITALPSDVNRRDCRAILFSKTVRAVAVDRVMLVVSWLPEGALA